MLCINSSVRHIEVTLQSGASYTNNTAAGTITTCMTGIVTARTTIFTARCVGPITKLELLSQLLYQYSQLVHLSGA